MKAGIGADRWRLIQFAPAPLNLQSKRRRYTTKREKAQEYMDQQGIPRSGSIMSLVLEEEIVAGKKLSVAQLSKKLRENHGLQSEWSHKALSEKLKKIKEGIPYKGLADDHLQN